MGFDRRMEVREDRHEGVNGPEDRKLERGKERGC